MQGVVRYESGEPGEHIFLGFDHDGAIALRRLGHRLTHDVDYLDLRLDVGLGGAHLPHRCARGRLRLVVVDRFC